MPTHRPPFIVQSDGYVRIPGGPLVRWRIVEVDGKKQWKMDMKDPSDNEENNGVVDSRD